MEATTPVTVRRATSGDVERIVELAEQLGYPMEVATATERLEITATQQHRAMVVAEIEGRLIGWLEFEVRHNFLGGTFAEIEGLVVDAETRRSGAGRALVAWAEGEAQYRGITKLRVRSNTKREEPVVFYPAVGFTMVKLVRTFEKRLH